MTYVSALARPSAVMFTQEPTIVSSSVVTSSSAFAFRAAITVTVAALLPVAFCTVSLKVCFPRSPIRTSVVPLGFRAPFQSPDAVTVSAFLLVQRSLTLSPTAALVVETVSLTSGALTGGGGGGGGAAGALTVWVILPWE